MLLVKYQLINSYLFILVFYILILKVFRSLPEWNVLTDLGTTTYWVFEATHVNNNSANLLDVACDEDVEMVDCRRSTVFPTWNDTIPAYYPG